MVGVREEEIAILCEDRDGHVGPRSGVGPPPKQVHRLRRTIRRTRAIPLQGWEYLAILVPRGLRDCSSSPYARFLIHSRNIARSGDGSGSVIAEDRIGLASTKPVGEGVSIGTNSGTRNTSGHLQLQTHGWRVFPIKKTGLLAACPRSTELVP